jgi:glycosyltransferase involved in cell wall biosynthesis
MPENPMFSVVIPTFNRAGFIVKTIQSVLNQDFQDFEIIVVDDGSTDETETVVNRIASPRIRYFKRENKERAAARNFGVHSSSGAYVTFLDSDDLFKPNHLSEANRFLAKHPGCPVVALGYEIITPDGKILYPFKTLPSPVNEKLCEGNFLSCMGVFIRREIILENHFNEDRDLSGSEDYELWLRIAARYPILTVPVVTAAIVNHESRSVLQVNPDKLEQRRKLLKRYIWSDPIFTRKFGRSRPKLNGYMDLYVALHLAMGSYRRESFWKLLRSFGQYPLMAFNYRFWVVLKKIFLF